MGCVQSKQEKAMMGQAGPLPLFGVGNRPSRLVCLSAAKVGPELTVSLSLVREDVLSLIKDLHVLFSHKNISWGNLVSVLMDSGNVMRATKVDMKKPFERQSMSLLTYSLMAVPPGLSEPFWAELEESL